MFYPKYKAVAFLTSKYKDVKVNDYFITLDLETRTLFNGNLEVISGVIYTGTEFLTYFIIAYNNDSKKLIYALIKDLFESAPKSMSTNIYIHNFSHFDSVFILRTLAEYSSTFSIILSFLAILLSKKERKTRRKYY